MWEDEKVVAVFRWLSGRSRWFLGGIDWRNLS